MKTGPLKKQLRFLLSTSVGVTCIFAMVTASAYGDKAPISAPTTQPSTGSAELDVGLGPSGEVMPVGDLPGWRQVMTDDFATDVAVGGFPGPEYSKRWDVYPDGTPDTAGQNANGIGRYFPSKVVSVNGGVLNKFVHTENGTAMTAALLAKESFGQTYGRYSVRFRADPVKGYKMAWLLWPDSERWPDDGEIDFPEGNLDGKFYGAAHFAAPWTGKHQNDRFETGATFGDWHTATTEWTPGTVEFFLDGKKLGTSTKKTPNKPMHWVLQTETCIEKCQPQPDAQGNVQIDWVAMYERN